MDLCAVACLTSLNGLRGTTATALVSRRPSLHPLVALSASEVEFGAIVEVRSR